MFKVTPLVDGIAAYIGEACVHFFLQVTVLFQGREETPTSKASSDVPFAGQMSDDSIQSESDFFQREPDFFLGHHLSF